MFFITRAALHDQFDARLRSEAASLMEEYRSGGFADLRAEVAARSRAPGQIDFGLIGSAGERAAGVLYTSSAPVGWSVARVQEPGEPAETERLLVIALPQGGRLIMADDIRRIDAVSDAILQAFGWAFGLVLLLGAGGGVLLSRGYLARIDAIGRTAQAIIEGDLSRRVPYRGRGPDELERLALTLNTMLDRIAGLMESLKQVSNDIAHDLRTPLSRMRQRLEGAAEAQTSPGGKAAIDRALAECDDILSTFEALLRIAQIEGSASRQGFRPMDLRDVAETVIDAFAPTAEDAGAVLDLVPGEPAPLVGDRALLTQMVANLIENALAHAGPSPQVGVRIWQDGGLQLAVCDNGPGVPDAVKGKVFERFYRLEQSRTSPGSGLGLPLVRAIARLHHAEAWLEDGRPGLTVRVQFPSPAGAAGQ